ncbi:MAG TPA: hypothetical protein VLI72_07605 [Methylibium sp.]|nr:hypothetical protein [Methylibium sp.]
MQNTTLDKLAWLLIYGGLLLLMFGLWTLSGTVAIGAALAAVGATAAVVGALLIWWRSRRPDGP